MQAHPSQIIKPFPNDVGGIMALQRTSGRLGRSALTTFEVFLVLALFFSLETCLLWGFI